MKVNLENVGVDIKFEDLNSGSFFWVDNLLYLKPSLSYLTEEELNSKDGFAINLGLSRLITFSDDTVVIPEPRPLQISLLE